MKIFVVEDDSWYAQFLKHHLSKNEDFDIEIINDGKTLLSKLSEKPDLITLDYNLPDIEGVDLLNKVLTFNSNLNVIVVSEQKDIKIATKLIKIGAFDYIVKDDDSAINIWNSCLKVAKLNSLENKVVELKNQLKNNSKKVKIIGSCPQLEKVFSLTNKASKVNIPISILGETGTGKELIAKEIFENYTSSKNDLVTVNISSLNPNLIESELFGHEPGAFTGAIHKHLGYFEQANGSVLFLDEIAELPLNIQSKLLRVLQEKVIRRVGGNKDIKINFKLITATHKDLRKEVNDGNFREDLYFRIKGMTIELPPLRERGSDIILLAEHFIKSFTVENQLDKISIHKSAKKKLMDYSFPGNVRELKSIIDLACVLCDSEITDEHIQLESMAELQLLEKERTLKEYEYLIINYFLDKYNNNVVEVAKLLDIGKSTIYRIIKEEEFKKYIIMKGIILDSYVDFVENKFGIQKLNKIEENLRSPIDYYTLKTYGDEEFYKLIEVSEVVLQLSKEKIQYQFGEFFFEVLIENYGHHFHKSNLIDFLIYLEDYIHPEVIETIEESEPPRFLLEEKENGFKLTYSSKRKMGDFAFGLLMRCNTFFENTYEIEKISSEGINTVFHIYKK